MRENFTRITGIKVWDGLWEVQREQVYDNINRVQPRRVDNRTWSKKSRRKLISKIAKGKVVMKSMAVLTFPECLRVRDGKIAKKCLNRFLVKLRRKYPPVEYFWVQEFQRNGSPHFHVMVNVPREDIDRLWMGRSWAQSVMFKSPQDWGRGLRAAEDMIKVHSHPKQWQLLRTEDGAARYLLSYVSKPYQKSAPRDYVNVGRFWGCSKGVVGDTEPDETWPIDESTLRVVLASWGLTWVASWDYLPKYIHVPLGIQGEGGGFG